MPFASVSGARTVCFVHDAEDSEFCYHRHFANILSQQAKNLVESAPTLVKEDLTKDEADAYAAQLEAVGAKIEIV